MARLLDPESPLIGVDLVLLLVVILLSTVFFICFSGFVKYSIILNIIKSAMGTQQIPPAIVVNLLASLMALNSIWPYTEPGLLRIKPLFAQNVATAGENALEMGAMGEGSAVIDVNKKKTMYSLLVNFLDYFPELAEHAEKKTRELTATVNMPIQFSDKYKNCKFMLGSLLHDLYKGFEFGLKLYLIFLSIDFLVAIILTGVGMSMMSPTVISTPIKLAIFYFSDSWTVLFNTM